MQLVYELALHFQGTVSLLVLRPKLRESKIIGD